MRQENLSAMATTPKQATSSVPLLVDILHGRRSRRFAPGMKIESGPFAYTSRHASVPLSEAEEAALAFAACGVTGYALADLAYGKGQGGQMLAGLLGRTVASPDAINTVSVVVTNDEATYLTQVVTYVTLLWYFKRTHHLCHSERGLLRAKNLFYVTKTDSSG